jgi:hypothetical protein
MQLLCQRFVKTWLAATILGLVILAGLNVLVDPAGAYSGIHLSAFESLRYLNLNRVTKAEMASRGDWEVIILGSSRAEAGFPASHPVLTTNRACNLSLAAARFPELAAVFDFACEHNHLKHVLLCLDWYMFAEGPRWVDNFLDSRFNPDFARFPYYCKQLIGRAATDRTWETIRRKLQGRRPVAQDTRGFHNHSIAAGTSQRELFDRALHVLALGYRAQKAADRGSLELFRHIVRTCHNQKVDLQVVIMPVHALETELVYAAGRESDYERWKADLVAVLAEEGVEGKFILWDFPGYAGPPAEAVPPEGDTTNRMRFYFENSHCTPLLGGIMLDEIWGSAGTNVFGAKLTRSNLQSCLAGLHEARAVYARTNAADFDWVQRIALEPAPKHP